MRSKAPLLVLLALVVSPSLAQPGQINAICTNFELRILNGDSGTPCALAHAVLSNAGIASTEPGLPPGQAYGPPSNDSYPFASATMCMTEMYNLVQGCAACQQTTAVAEQLTYPTLAEWSRRCTDLGFTMNSANFATLNENGVIPLWAQTPPVGGTFNVANLLATLSVPSEPGVSPSPAFASSTQSPTAIPQAAEVSASTPPIGAIVGGVVGGVVVLLAIGGVIFWVCRRKRSRSHTAPSAEFTNARHIPLAQDDEDDREMHAPARHSLVGDAPPAFTPGQFKDPIFEKGVAISTGAMAMSSVGHSPVTSYSPATPSTVQQGGPLRQSSGDQYQSSADAYQSSASHQYQTSADQYRSSVDQYRTDVHPHSPHSPEMTQGYRD